MSNNTSTGAFLSIWLTAFLILKLGGTSLAAWSWWWILLPAIPVLVIVFKSLGVL